MNTEEEREEAKKKIDSLDEYLISDVELICEDDVECNMTSEWEFDYYVGLAELFEELEEYQIVPAIILIDYDPGYYRDLDLLRSAIDDTSLYSDWDEIVDNFVDNCLLFDISDDRLRSTISTYLDYEKIQRDLDISGIFVEN